VIFCKRLGASPVSLQPFQWEGWRLTKVRSVNLAELATGVSGKSGYRAEAADLMAPKPGRLFLVFAAMAALRRP
jgi:hypothetical protein